MNSKKEVVSYNLFLNEHAGIKEFVRHFAYHSVICSNTSHLQHEEKSWYIVCERPEDVSVLQQHIMRELEGFTGKKIEISGGISFYTLDQLGRHFCATLGLATDKNKAHLPKFLFKPYLDIEKQEKIIDFILNLFHFSTQGNLAKQLLTLIDAQLPSHLNIFDALINALQLKKKRSYKDISEVFLKQILASIQAAQFVLNRYSRLQNLVWDFLNDASSRCLTVDSIESFSFPKKFFTGSVLWISAPEYESSHSLFKKFRPGKFSSILIDDFLECILKIRQSFEKVEETIFIHQRTVLKSNKSSSPRDLDQLSLYSASNKIEFYKNFLKFIDIQDNSILPLAGEFDPNMFQSTRKDGGGSYKLLKKDILAWRRKNEDNFFAQELFSQIDVLYDDFLDTASYIDNYSKLVEIAKIYSIPIRDFSDSQLDEIFCSKIITESFEYKKDPRFSIIPKSYSFFSVPNIPEKIVVFWSKNHFEKISFATRIINQVFALLQSHGVDIENPCNEKTFSEFWKHIIGLKAQFPKLQIEFHVDSLDSLENFPIDLKKKKIFALDNHSVPFTNEESEKFALQKILKIDYHDSCLKFLFDKIQINQISTTQFESYIRCPFQFFLENCANLSIERPKDPFSIEPQILGTKVHKICDLLLSQMVSEFGNDEYIEQSPQIYEKVISILSPSELFLSNEKIHWKNALSVLPKNIQNIFFESIDEIFDSQDSSTSMSSILFVEMLKRTFLKFLHSEIKNMRIGNKYRVGIVREYPFEITLGAIKIRGRIDRIDMNKDGYEIIDYKVSPISKNTKLLSILPSEIQTNKNNVVSSIQGAIYALAFGKKVFDANNILEKENCLSAFSLYRLKNIKEEADAMLTYSFFTNERLPGKAQVEKIEKELVPYAENLFHKKFLPNPLLKKQTCQYCNFQNICPYSLREE